MAMSDRQEIRTFIEQLLRQKGDSKPCGDGESLILSGRLQSIDAVEIVMFLESRFGLDFASIGFDQAEIDSIEKIHALAIAHMPVR
jgi:acyl carrier protein